MPRGGREKLTHQAINYMLSVRVVRRMDTLPPNEIHDFMFSFAGNTSIGNDDLQLQARPGYKHVCELLQMCSRFSSRDRSFVSVPPSIAKTAQADP